MNRSTQFQGFTLIEMMITVLVVAILAALALPAMSDFVKRQRLKDAAEFVYGKVVFARTEAIKQSKEIHVRFATGADGAWSMGISDDKAAVCDLGDPTTCTIQTIVNSDDDDVTLINYVFSGSNYADITLGSNFPSNHTSFEPVRGTATNGSATLSSSVGEIRVVVSILGRILMCSPAGSNKIHGYRDC